MGQALLEKLQPTLAKNFAKFYGLSSFMEIKYEQLAANIEPSGSCFADPKGFYDAIAPDLVRFTAITKLIEYTSINAATGLLAAYICRSLPAEFGPKFLDETIQLSFAEIPKVRYWQLSKAYE